MPDRTVHFFESVQLALINYFNFQGRSSRGAFWYFVLATFAFSILLSMLSYITNPELLITISAIYHVLIIIPYLALKVRRLHDVNKSGWWILIAFTGVGYFLLLYWYCLKGTLGANYYGEDIEAGCS